MGRLAQGIRDENGTNTIFFINKAAVPAGRRTVTYGCIVFDIRHRKDEPERT
jgi:hypothetical protein